jgi:hypothetical protein
VFVKTEVTQRADTVNQIGVLVLNRNESWRPNELSLASLKERIQLIAGTLENSDIPSLANNTILSREHQFTAGDKLVFLEINDATIWDLANQDTTTLSQLSGLINVLSINSLSQEAGSTVKINSASSGVTIDMTIQDKDPGMSAFLARLQSRGALLDFSGLNGVQVSGTLQIGREADYDSVVGFYKVLDAEGSVRDRLTGQILQPGQEGYAAAALHNDNLISNLSGIATADEQTISRSVTLSESGILAPYAIVNTGSGQQTYFAFNKANHDGHQHFQMFADNHWGFEDTSFTDPNQPSDADFEDLFWFFKPTDVTGTLPLAS